LATTVAKRKVVTSQVKGSKFYSQQWDDAEIALGSGAATLLWGPPGTGKSWAARLIGSARQSFSITLTPDTPAAELRGHYIVGASGTFEWHDGPATAAWRAGCRLSVDEIGEATGDALTHLYTVADDPDVAQLTLPNRETVRPKKGFQMVATTNQEPTVLPPALADRFLIFEITEPHPNAVLSLPEAWQEVAWNTTRIEDPRRKLSIRRFHQAVRLYKYTGDLERSLKLTFGTKGEALLDSIRVTGKALS
jgi:MoxR-like ATPase